MKLADKGNIFMGNVIIVVFKHSCSWNIDIKYAGDIVIYRLILKRLERQVHIS